MVMHENSYGIVEQLQLPFLSSCAFKSVSCAPRAPCGLGQVLPACVKWTAPAGYWGYCCALAPSLWQLPTAHLCPPTGFLKKNNKTSIGYMIQGERIRHTWAPSATVTVWETPGHWDAASWPLWGAASQPDQQGCALCRQWIQSIPCALQVARKTFPFSFHLCYCCLQSPKGIFRKQIIKALEPHITTSLPILLGAVLQRKWCPCLWLLGHHLVVLLLQEPHSIWGWTLGQPLLFSPLIQINLVFQKNSSDNNKPKP